MRRLDHAGYRTVWVNEVIGKDAFVQLGVLLAETERMVFGTCIANIWARPAQTMHAAAAQLAEAYPGRLVDGSGRRLSRAGGQCRAGIRPSAGHDARLLSSGWMNRRGRPSLMPRTPGSSRRTGRKCLPWRATSPTGHSRPGCLRSSPRRPGSALGPDKLLVVGLSLDPDPTVVRDSAREHLLAGADHVTILPPLDGDFRAASTSSRQLAPTLTGWANPAPGWCRRGSARSAPRCDAVRASPGRRCPNRRGCRRPP